MDMRIEKIKIYKYGSFWSFFVCFDVKPATTDWLETFTILSDGGGDKVAKIMIVPILLTLAFARSDWWDVGGVDNGGVDTKCLKRLKHGT